MAFMILTNSGHTAIAKSIKDQQLYLAWGDLPEYLTAPGSVLAAETTDAVGNFPLGQYAYVITTITDAGETPASTVANVTISNPIAAIKLTWSAVSNASGYKIYGRSITGDKKYITTVTTTEWIDKNELPVGAAIPPTTNTTSADPWTTSPTNPSITHNGLYRELGRRKIVSTRYVLPDPDGPYVTNQGRWSESAEPTRYIYGYIAYDLTDAPNSTIYQYGIFIGTVPTAGNENKQYLLPIEVANKGSLLSIENVSPIFRNSSTREFYEIVMTF